MFFLPLFVASSAERLHFNQSSAILDSTELGRSLGRDEKAPFRRTEIKFSFLFLNHHWRILKISFDISGPLLDMAIFVAVVLVCFRRELLHF